jgi:hypothetical protein
MTAEWKLNDKETLDFLTRFSESRSDRSVTYMYELLRAFQSLTQQKLLEYLRANPPEDSYGCVIDDPQYTAMFESMLTELEAQHE